MSDASVANPLPIDAAVSRTRVQVNVCTTCRLPDEPLLPTAERAGARLFASLAVALADDASVDLVGVECLSVCKRACTVSFAAPGKWTYIYGDLPPETATPVIVAALAQYAATPDGLIPWRLRSDAIRKGVVARLPPFPAVDASVPKAPA